MKKSDQQKRIRFGHLDYRQNEYLINSVHKSIEENHFFPSVSSSFVVARFYFSPFALFRSNIFYIPCLCTFIHSFIAPAYHIATYLHFFGIQLMYSSSFLLLADSNNNNSNSDRRRIIIRLLSPSSSLHYQCSLPHFHYVTSNNPAATC